MSVVGFVEKLSVLSRGVRDECEHDDEVHVLHV